MRSISSDMMLRPRLAEEIMNSQKYQLHPNYGDLFQYKADKTNKEFILTMDAAKPRQYRYQLFPAPGARNTAQVTGSLS